MSAAALESLVCDTTARKVHQCAMLALVAATFLPPDACDFCLSRFVVGTLRR